MKRTAPKVEQATVKLPRWLWKSLENEWLERRWHSDFNCYSPVMEKALPVILRACQQADGPDDVVPVEASRAGWAVVERFCAKVPRLSMSVGYQIIIQAGA